MRTEQNTSGVSKEPNGIKWFFAGLVVFFLCLYGFTTLTFPHPGKSAGDLAAAAGLLHVETFAHPVYQFVAAGLAHIGIGALPVRMNLFAAVFGALSVGALFLFFVQFFIVLTHETPGGGMRAVIHPEGDEEDEDPLPQDEVVLPESVLQHNTFSQRSSLFGALAGTFAYALCIPFWLSTTHLNPFPFDFCFFLVILTLLAGYKVRGDDPTFYTGIFLSSLFALESPFFLLLFPVSCILFFKMLALRQDDVTRRIPWGIAAMVAGLFLNALVLWYVGRHAFLAPFAGFSAVMDAILTSIAAQITALVPELGTKLYATAVVIGLLLFLLPPILQWAWSRRTWFYVFCELLFLALAAVHFLNVPYTLWTISCDVQDPPVYTFFFLAFGVGMLVAAWDLAREHTLLMPDTHASESDEDELYESPREDDEVCNLLPKLCWLVPILLVAMIPFGFRAVSPSNSLFTREVMDRVSAYVHEGDWIFCNDDVRNIVLLGGGQNERQLFAPSLPRDLHFVPAGNDINQAIVSDPGLDRLEVRLLNSADLSFAVFLEDWMLLDTNAYRRILLQKVDGLCDDTRYVSLPDGFFFRLYPKEASPDSLEVLKTFSAFIDSLGNFFKPQEKFEYPYYAAYRLKLRKQVAILGNELGCRLYQEHHSREALELFRRIAELDPSNYAILFNRFDILSRQFNGHSEEFDVVENEIRSIPAQVDAFTVNEKSIFQSIGRLITPEIIPILRSRYWIQRGRFYKFMSAAERLDNQRLLESVQNKKRELQNIVRQELDANELDKALSALQLLSDLDDKDPFIAQNQARIAILKGDRDDAARWMAKIPADARSTETSVWNEASLLFLSGKLDEAKEMLNKSLPDHTDDVNLWGLLGDILLRQERFDELERRVLPALRNANTKRDHYLLYQTQGYLLLRAKNLPAARASLLRALELNRYLEKTHEDVLRIDDELGIPSFAIEDAKDCLRRDRNHPLANYLLGMARYHEGKYTLARELFETSLKSEETAGALAGLGAVCLEEKNMKDAEDYLKRAYRRERGRSFTVYTYVHLLLATNRLPEAEKMLNEALAADPDDFRLKAVQFEIHAAAGRMQKAYDLMKEIRPDAKRLPPYEQRTLERFSEEFSRRIGE
ncbi:MAG: tetratricopeptide repeat protein [Kiritimatiellae bacterium]|nr:tetratricopeptide repeat protein [Kiritimatiellia bacterium]